MLMRSPHQPAAISEHNGTNCSRERLQYAQGHRFQVDHAIRRPVYVNISATTEVSGTGQRHDRTIHDTGFTKRCATRTDHPARQPARRTALPVDGAAARDESTRLASCTRSE